MSKVADELFREIKQKRRLVNQDFPWLWAVKDFFIWRSDTISVWDYKSRYEEVNELLGKKWKDLPRETEFWFKWHSISSDTVWQAESDPESFVYEKIGRLLTSSDIIEYIVMVTPREGAHFDLVIIRLTKGIKWTKDYFRDHFSKFVQTEA